MHLGNLADSLLTGLTWRSLDENSELILACVTVSELGYKRGATFLQIRKGLASWGLSLCPKNTGLRLRLQYLNQPKGERLHIGTSPITDRQKTRFIFVVENIKMPWITADFGNGDCFFEPSCRFIFTFANSSR